MKFNHRVAAAVWDDAAGRWAVTIEKVYLDGSVEEIQDTCVRPRRPAPLPQNADGRRTSSCKRQAC